MIPRILIIAGSDSGAGAGIQADIKAAAANKVYASTAITAITAQNTVGVQHIFNLPTETIKHQIISVMEDIDATIIKTGMLSNSEIITMVADAIKKYKTKLVLDPVMVSKSGAKLLQDDAIEALKTKLIPVAFLLTPNIPEAEVLIGSKICSEEDMEEAAKKIISDLGCEAVLLKGGHMPSNNLVDILVEKNGNITKIKSKKIFTENTHGTGCTYASSIAAFLARGYSLQNSVKKSHSYLYKAIKTAKKIGSGKSPVNHFWKFYGAADWRKRVMIFVLFIALIKSFMLVIQQIYN
jgi:hydroxymethylpyrimidine/phosphomethylpyrimidine kinase